MIQRVEIFTRQCQPRPQPRNFLDRQRQENQRILGERKFTPEVQPLILCDRSRSKELSMLAKDLQLSTFRAYPFGKIITLRYWRYEKNLRV